MKEAAVAPRSVPLARFLGPKEWTLALPTAEPPRLRLFCFAHAGAGAYSFAPLFQNLPPGVEVCLVQRPGRENLAMLPLLRSVRDLTLVTSRHLIGLLDLPYAFFGHSMGALMAFELIKHFQSRGLPGPRRAFFSGYRAPHIPWPVPRIAAYPRREFFEAVRTYYSDVPADLLSYSRTAAYFEAILRADFAACEQYEFTSVPALKCPVTVMGGCSDPLVPVHHLQAWASHYPSLELVLFAGAHMYLQDAPEVFERELSIRLAPLVAG